MKEKSSLAVYINCSGQGILALLIEYDDDVEAGILNIESDADNTARQRIPITKAWPKLFMGRKKKHLQKSCHQRKQKIEETNTSNIPCQQNRPIKTLQFFSLQTRPMPGMSTWHFSRSPGSDSHGRDTHFFHVQIFGCK